ncbi:zinc finger protein 609 [Echinococcus multilocularis]|uniref:Zinc finger protein 609 n=1 Tax=Echinococcus multilocularis TaxID=6211 RepID=A0A068YHP8_ECHMU|nr:zinc finger protein 609 [Echinococcus multilocularis]
MPSGSTSTMTSAATVVPAPPGVFATSMPPELPNSSSPVPSSEDRESISSNESRKRRATSVANGVAASTGVKSLSSSSYSTPPQFIIDSNKAGSPTSSFSKLRKKVKSSRSRVSQNGGTYCVNKPLKVTIRRTNAHSHTLDSSQLDGRLSPSSVYSSVPGDDEKSPVLPSGLPESFRSPSPHCMSNLKGVDSYGGKKDVATSTVDSSTMTEPDLLGPCEPGSKIVLEGIVWLETPGMMVVNAHWRGRAFLGTFLDASRNTLGPSCPDKMVSSLSMVKCKPNWGGPSSTSSGAYRSSTSGTNAASTSSGPIRTRSAIAAAEDSSMASRRRALPSSTSSGRGRRRRRGIGMVTSSSTTSLPTDGIDSSLGDQDDGAAVSNTLSDTPSTSDFACPQMGCKKRFADIIGVRFHLDQCHAQRQEQEAHATEASNIAIVEVHSSSSPTGQAPPQLAKVNSNGGGCSLEPMDEDPPPPKLDRGPTADEVVESSGMAMCEPPTASPAYSDISDDAPAAPQKSRSTVEVGHRPWPPPTVVNQPQTQPMDWSAAGRRVVSSGKSPYDYASASQPPPTGITLAPFAAAAVAGGASGGSPYAHQQSQQSHHRHRPLNIPPTAHTSDKLFQAHFANLMAAGGNPSNNTNNPQPPNRQSPQVIPPGISQHHTQTLPLSIQSLPSWSFRRALTSMCGVNSSFLPFLYSPSLIYPYYGRNFIG